MSNKKIQTDRGICKFFIQDKCSREDECQWTHTKKQCEHEGCEVYTDRKLCFKCNKKQSAVKKADYEKRLKERGRPCVNNWDRIKRKKGECDNLTLNGEYCNECFNIASEYLIGPCRNRNCFNRVKGARGYCEFCQN